MISQRTVRTKRKTLKALSYGKAEIARNETKEGRNLSIRGKKPLVFLTKFEK